MNLEQIKSELELLADPSYAEVSKRFFKTGPGEYGEGDLFIGIRVPALRRLVNKLDSVDSQIAILLLQSPIHEERQLGLFILIKLYKNGDNFEKEQIFKLYLKNTSFINNWDLVDASAEHIVGDFLRDKDKQPLIALALSKMVWERRIAIISTFSYIKQNSYNETIKIAEILLNDEHDLIQKAVGWMLREIGKRDQNIETAFLNNHFREMPRTMLRYAIEKFEESLRQSYLKI